MTRRDLIHKWLVYALGLLPVWLLDAYILPRVPLWGTVPMLLPLAAAAGVFLPPEELSLLDQVSNLPEKQRTVLHLHYYQGYGLREIARLLGVTVPTVKMRLKRGREALRKELL